MVKKDKEQSKTINLVKIGFKKKLTTMVKKKPGQIQSKTVLSVLSVLFVLSVLSILSVSFLLSVLSILSVLSLILYFLLFL